MKKWLRNQTVILSGASGGIGKQLCLILIRKYGAKVIGIGRSERKMQALLEELGDKAVNFSYRLFDVADENAWIDLASSLESQAIVPTMLINNAGVFPSFDKAVNCPSALAEEIMKTNFLSTVYAVNALLPLIKQSSSPSVYFICSSSALCSVVGSAFYASSKSAMKAYAETLALENDKKSLYVGVAFPGATKTDLFRNDQNAQNSALDKVASSPEKMAKKIAKAIYKKKRRIVPGADAKMMNFTAKVAPVKGPALIKSVMKASKSKVFTKVFDYEQK